MNYSETPNIAQSIPTDSIAIETIVRRILEEGLHEKETHVQAHCPQSNRIKKMRTSEHIGFEDTEAFLDEEGMDA